MKKLLPTFFLLFVIIQLAVPLNLAWQAEMTLRHGTPVKFRLELRDPYDPFRGKYVLLRYDWGEPQAVGEDAVKGLREVLVCAHVDIDPDGFGTVTDVSIQPPNEGLWFRVPAKTFNGTYSLEPQFDRYFVNEHEAQVAEELYFESMRELEDDGGPAQAQSYAIVRLRKGTAQLEDVFLDERSLAATARDHVEGRID